MDASIFQVPSGGVLLILGLTMFVVSTLWSPLNKIPGPWYAKWTSLISTYQTLRGNLPFYVDALHKSYGPIIRTGPNSVYIADTGAWQQMTNVKQELLKSPKFYWALHPGIENVFTTVDREVHRHFRRLLASNMSETALKEFVPRIEPKHRAAIAGMRDEMEQRGVVDILKWWHLMTFDVLTDLVFGEAAGVLQKGEVRRRDHDSQLTYVTADLFKQQKDQTLLDLEYLGQAITVRIAFPELAWILTPRFPVPPKAAENAKRWRQHSTDAIQRHQRLVDNSLDNEVKPTLFSKLYKAKDGDSLSFVNIRDNSQVYLTAGTGTTATTLSFLVWSVCKHARVKQKLVDELRTHLRDLGDGFGYDDVKDLPYLNCVIKETLRLYSAVPTGMPRVAPPGGITLAGRFVPAGTWVAAQAFSMHRIGDVFPEPDAFIPERWERPTKEMRQSSMAFGGGSRNCLGLHLAELQLRLATARFFSAFPDARNSQREGMSDEAMEQTMFVLLAPKGRKCVIELS